VYVLASLNEYAVVVGYSDWMGFLLQAIGATACASGWHNSLKQFTLGRFLPQTGGRRPRKRCSSLPLISNPLIVPELEDVYRVGLLPSVLSGSRFDNLLSDGPAQGETDWNDTVSCLAHWDSLSRLCASVESLRTVAARLDAAIARIRAARALYRRLEAADVHFEPQTGPDHLESWLEAIRAFRQEAGV
jgi:hypothetical protein